MPPPKRRDGRPSRGSVLLKRAEMMVKKVNQTDVFNLHRDLFRATYVIISMLDVTFPESSQQDAHTGLSK